MKFNKKIIIAIFFVFMLFFTQITVESKNISKEENQISGEITADLKVRTLNGNWKDTLSSISVGTIVEFKITVSIPRSYTWLGVLVELPTTANGPMFNYRVGTMSPTILDVDVGITYANDEEVAWNWITVDPPFEQTMTFKATVQNTGTANVVLTVGGLYGDNGQAVEHEGSDSLRFSSAKSKSKNISFKEKLLEIFPRIAIIIERLNELLKINI